MKLSAVILALTTTEQLFTMTLSCIESLMISEPEIDIEIIMIESNKNFNETSFKYPDFVKIIIPESEFNFHQFLNIGIKASTGDFIALCNNDLIFYKNWFSEILKVSKKRPEILSFSPLGKSTIKNKKETFEIGYKVMTHVKGWCLIVKKELFDKIGFLDETFNFYFADNDYAMTLKCNNIKHALVYNSKVDHLEKKSLKNEEDLINEEQAFLQNYKIPKYLFEDKYQWVLSNENNLSGFLKFHNKWGSPDLLYKKNKLADILIKYNLGVSIRYFFKFRL